MPSRLSTEVAPGPTARTAARPRGRGAGAAWLLLSALASSQVAGRAPQESLEPRTGTGTAQGPDRQAEPPVIFRGTVDVVEILIEVAVTDRRGTPILGLGIADFLVEEDGVQVEVVHVESLAGPASQSLAELPMPPATELVRPAPPTPLSPPGHNYLLVLHHLLYESDRSTLGAKSRKFAAVRDLRRWIADGLEAGDCVAVLAYDSRLKPVQDFSDDRATLDRAIRQALMERSRAGRQQAFPGCPSLWPHLPTGGVLRDRTTSISAGLATLAQAAGRIEGRKHLLLFSLGVGLSSGGQAGPGPTDSLSLSQMLNANQITAYTMDLTPPRVRHAMEATLQSLARQTGGRYFGRSIAFSVPLQAIGAQLAGSYRIAFRSRHPAGMTGYRTLEVRATEPSFRVSSPRGYIVREPRAGNR